jgi:uracil-DNA glycosylase
MDIQKISQQIRKEDSRGNYIRLDSHSLEILLKDGSSRERRIGSVIEKNGQITYYKKEDEAEIHRKSKSWSINRIILDSVSAVEYETDKAIYRINAAQAHKYGITFKWDNKSFVDKKTFVPIMHWEITWKNAPSNALLNNFGYEWYSEMQSMIEKPYFSTLFKNLKHHYSNKQIYPAKENVFLPFKLTNFMNVKVVVVVPTVFPSTGANGLAFGFEGDGSIPLSTKMFVKEIEQDIYSGCLMLNVDYSMRQYADQGVLMLNYVATGDKTGPNTNIGWESFTEDIIALLSTKKEHLVFMIYSNSSSNTLSKHIDHSKHHVLLNGVPYTPEYKPGKYFTECNSYLLSKKKAPISW